MKKNTTLYASSIFTGAVLAFLSARVIFQGSWLNLVPWAIAGTLIGVFSPTRKATTLAGALYGVFLVTSFMIFNFQGDNSQLGNFLALTAILAAVGIAAGIALAHGGYWAQHRAKKQH